MSVFQDFCKYVDDTIFSADNMGSVVAFVVDKSFINEFCRIHKVTEQALLDDVGNQLWKYAPNISHIKGVLAIQLYAASLRARSGGITERNYRDRLSELLDWEMNDLQNWMTENQDNYWRKLYDWCKSHFFTIAQSHPKFGAGRYVQYPVQQALRVFNKEDLLYIAHCFVENKLHPDDDLTEREFWRIISWEKLASSHLPAHARNIFYTYEYREDARKQIYNFFIRWDGEYKTYQKKQTDTDVSEQFAYLNPELDALEIRDRALRLKKKIVLKSLTFKAFQTDLTVRRPYIILFKKDDLYEGYWQETRFLVGDE